jgi:hypothetical protein
MRRATDASSGKSDKKNKVITFNKTKGAQEEPKPPFPAQHQPYPGIESKVKPRPRFQAPLHRGSGKLQDKVALITGGDSGIGRAVAILYAREGVQLHHRRSAYASGRRDHSGLNTSS